jgi:flavin-dependent dehydrogenase
MSIAATVTLDAATRRTWDAIVVGAGPAGALAAHQVACRGVSVLLVDRATFPRGKVCGCCINGRALGALHASGLGHLPASCGAIPLTTLLLTAGRRSARLPLAGVALSREAFDAALVRAAIAAGASFLPLTRARLGDSPRQLHLEQGEQAVEVEARVVLAADGLGGGLLASAGGRAEAECQARIGAGVVLGHPPGFYQRGVVYMASGQHGYVGLVRLEDDRLDVAAALDVGAVRQAGGPGEVASAILSATGWPTLPGLAEASWKGTMALTRQMSRPGAQGAFAVGDAAGFVEPFTGEGMAWALAGALAVAPLAVRAVAGWRPSLLREWQAIHLRIVRNRQWACRTAAFVLRRPVLVGAIVGLLRWLPWVAWPVLRSLNSPRSLLPDGVFGCDGKRG